MIPTPARDDQRDKWQFEFDPVTVAKAAKAKLAFHRKRLKLWEDAIVTIKENIRSTGTIIKEDITEAKFSYSNNLTGGSGGPQVQVDSNMLRDLSSAAKRRAANREHVMEYEAWVAFLAVSTADYLKLSINDYKFFFGGSNDLAEAGDDN